MTETPTDTIAGGVRDADRLARQARIMARASLAFLEDAGARAGAACVDVGCGDGQIALALAEVVGGAGRVVGVDVDDDALDLARAAAAEAGRRVEFLHADATTLAIEAEFDLACARLVLSHLVDPTIGPRLPAMLAAAGLGDLRHRTVENRIDTTEGKRFLVELLDNMREAILAAGAATAAELAEVRTAVDRAASDPAVVLHQVRMHQVSGRRPV